MLASLVGGGAPVAASSTFFAVDLYHRLAASERGNLAFAPFSTSTALAMTWGGARGATATDMRRTLHLSGTASSVHAGYRRLLADLGARTGCELVVANGLGGRGGHDRRPPVCRDRLHPI